MSVHYRHATEADLNQISAIEQRVMPSPWTYTSFKQAFDSLHSIILVAADDYRIYGFSVLYITAPEAELPDIVVDSDFRRQGIGRALLEYTVSEAVSRGVQTIYLEVRVSNQSARSMYDGIGFTQIGLRKYFYSNPVEDAICMSLDLEAYSATDEKI